MQLSRVRLTTYRSLVLMRSCSHRWDEAALEWFEIHPETPIRPHAKVRDPAAGAAKKAAELLERTGLPDLLRTL
jgi:hypothetical protein